MSHHDDHPLQSLEPFLGTWTLEPILPGAPPTDIRGHVTFEWLSGGGFLVERWEVPVPDAPNGLAVIGFHQRPQKVSPAPLRFSRGCTRLRDGLRRRDMDPLAHRA